MFTFTAFRHFFNSKLLFWELATDQTVVRRYSWLLAARRWVSRNGRDVLIEQFERFQDGRRMVLTNIRKLLCPCRTTADKKWKIRKIIKGSPKCDISLISSYWIQKEKNRKWNEWRFWEILLGFLFVLRNSKGFFLSICLTRKCNKCF